MQTNEILGLVKQKPSTLYGLKWIPTLEPEVSDAADSILPFIIDWPHHWTDINEQALQYAWRLCDAPPKLIVEIGVHRPEAADNGRSSTMTLLELKSKECMYIGIDITDKGHLNNLENNIVTICDNSANHDSLYKVMDSHGQHQIDFMFVDGDHSVNQVLAEWKYWDRMSPTGIMVLHDTNFHPGPVAVLDAVDTNIFSVAYVGRGERDSGVAIIKRLPR